MHPIESLEARISPASFSLTYTDVDGDLVKITAKTYRSTPLPLSMDILTFVGGGSSGQLARIDLTDPLFDRTAITFNVTKSGGDGFVNVGFLDAGENNLNRVVIPGDLGKIVVKYINSHYWMPSVLSVRSMGEFGLATQGGEGDLLSHVSGHIERFRILGDFKAEMIVFGVDSLSIGGDLIGSFGRGASFENARIAGNVSGSIIAGSIDKMHVGGDVSGVIDAGDDIGSIRIGGDLTGMLHGRSIRLGLIGGSVIGSEASETGTIFVDELMRKLRIGGDLIGGDVTGSESVFYSGAIEVVAASSIIIGGSVIAGTDAGEGSLYHSGTICAYFYIRSLKIGKSILGNETNPALIMAEGDVLTTASQDIAIGNVSVNGKVEFTQILAGFGAIDHKPMNPNASIGTIIVGGKWLASNVVAGAQDAGEPGFGVGDTLQAGDESPLVARIAKIVIKGNVTESPADGDSFGFVAQQIGALWVAGHKVNLTPGPSSTSDNFVLRRTGDVHVLEV